MLISVSDLQCNVGFYWNSFCLGCAKNALRKLVVNVMTFFSTIKFIYSEKATKFCEIFTLRLAYVVPIKSKGKISQNFVAFSEFMNFIIKNAECS